MTTVSVSEKALRELVREALDNTDFGTLAPIEAKEPVNVNPVVDPSAAVTDPIKPNFQPQNKVEFGVAVNNLVKGIASDKIPALYKSVTDAIDQIPDIAAQEEEEMKKKNDRVETGHGPANAKGVEEQIRMQIRSMLMEMSVDPADVAADEDPEEQELEKRAKRPGKYKPSSTDWGADTSFADMAKELGFSVAGAKQAADKALLKAQFVGQADQDELEILVLTAMSDYIKYLNKSGELTPSDVQLMKDHPEIVRELDGFREFLDKSLRRSMKGQVNLENPLGEADDLDQSNGKGLDEDDAGQMVGKQFSFGGGKAKVHEPAGKKSGTKPATKKSSPSVDWNGMDESKISKQKRS